MQHLKPIGPAVDRDPEEAAPDHVPRGPSEDQGHAHVVRPLDVPPRLRGAKGPHQSLPDDVQSVHHHHFVPEGDVSASEDHLQRRGDGRGGPQVQRTIAFMTMKPRDLNRGRPAVAGVPCPPPPPDREVLEGGEGGSGSQKFVYQKWPDQIFPTVNFGFSHDGPFGLGGGGG